jgi:uroporphyrinogen decarboxylase
MNGCKKMPETLTSRERVLKALKREESDRVPMDLGGTHDSSIVVEGYERLKAHFGVSSKTEIMQRMTRAVMVDEEVLRKLAIDTRAIILGAPTRGLAAELGPGAYRDMWGVERFQPEGSYYYDQRTAPLAGSITVTDVVRYPWPDPEDPGLLMGMQERLSWIRANTDAAAILTLPAPFVHLTQFVRGFEGWYMDFILGTDMLEALFDAVLEITLRIAERELEAFEVDVVRCGDDLGGQTGLQVSYEHYRRFIKPRHAKFFSRVRELTPAKLMFHSCGSIVDILDDLVDIGVDIINPVQVTARGMDPAFLKKKYGSKLVFWGGTDSQKTMPFGSVEDVRKMVEDLIETLGCGGGFVFSSCHNIQPDVSAEKVVAMFEHAREYLPSWKRA